MGENTCRIHVPPKVPVENYWSFVVYDVETRSLLDNGQPFPSIASNDNLKINADGSADLYFGPERPVGAVNWIRTVPVADGWAASAFTVPPKSSSKRPGSRVTSKRSNRRVTLRIIWHNFLRVIWHN
jgi:hypothetical protein